MVPSNYDEEQIKESSLNSQVAKKWLNGKDAKRLIIIKGKLINIVVQLIFSISNDLGFDQSPTILKSELLEIRCLNIIKIDSADEVGINFCISL